MAASRNFVSREARSIMVTVLGTVSASAIAFCLCDTAAPTTPGLSQVIPWAVRLATALTAGLTAVGILARSSSGMDDINRMLVTLTRAWLIIFVVIMLTVDGEAAIKTADSIRQQRLCANAARVLKAKGPALVKLGLSCSPPK